MATQLPAPHAYLSIGRIIHGGGATLTVALASWPRALTPKPNGREKFTFNFGFRLWKATTAPAHSKTNNRRVDKRRALNDFRLPRLVCCGRSFFSSHLRCQGLKAQAETEAKALRKRTDTATSARINYLRRARRFHLRRNNNSELFPYSAKVCQIR